MFIIFCFVPGGELVLSQKIIEAASRTTSIAFTFGKSCAFVRKAELI